MNSVGLSVDVHVTELPSLPGKILPFTKPIRLSAGLLYGSVSVSSSFAPGISFEPAISVLLIETVFNSGTTSIIFLGGLNVALPACIPNPSADFAIVAPETCPLGSPDTFAFTASVLPCIEPVYFTSSAS